MGTGCEGRQETHLIFMVRGFKSCFCSSVMMGTSVCKVRKQSRMLADVPLLRVTTVCFPEGRDRDGVRRFTQDSPETAGDQAAPGEPLAQPQRTEGNKHKIGKHLGVHVRPQFLELRSRKFCGRISVQ